MVSQIEKRDASLCHWADQTADTVIRERGDVAVYTCASGITPSGTVHIGNFREIMTVDLVARALRARGKKVRFIYSWDDYDVFRKVPLNMPNPEVLEGYLRQPITMVPDTTGRNENYARHHETDIERELPRMGIFPEFLYQAERYRANRYAEGMRRALRQRDVIKQCLNEFRDDAHKMRADDEYWPVSVFCAACNKDTTEITGYDGEYGVSYACKCGHTETGDLRSAKGFKLGWRVDWPMRWNEEKVAFEPGGKDHVSPGGSYDTAKLVAERVYGWQAPVTMKYDFVTLKGVPGKMSSSKGRVIALPDALAVYQPEVLRYIFAVNKPDHEFSISFDVDVINAYEAYDRMERIAWGVDKAKNADLERREKRLYALSQITDELPAVMPYQIGFRLLTTLLQTYSGDADAVIASLGDVKPEQVDTLKKRCGCAWFWVTECAPEEFRFSLRTDGSRADLSETESAAVKRIRDAVVSVMDEADEKTLGQKLYDVAPKFGMEPKAVFRAMYQALIGKDQGPRLASFMRIIGREKLERILAAY